MTYENLPDIDFFDVTVNDMVEAMVKDYEAAHLEQTGEGITLVPGDPIRIWIQAQAMRLFQLAEYGNYIGQQNFIRYASGAYLENKVAFLGLERLPAIKAKTTIRFYLQEPRQQVVTIPLGTMVSTTDNVNFVTTQVVTIPIGQSEITVAAEALEAGSHGNGYLPGQIKVLVSSVPYVQVTNTVASYGGADEEADDDLKERFTLAPESFSTAGPKEAYEYFAKSYSVLIEDVRANSLNPGEVTLIVLLENGEVPDPSFLNGLSEYVSDKKRRPLTDKVTVSGPTTTTYDVTVTYYLPDGADEVKAKLAVEMAVSDYILWQRSKIGRSRNPSELIRRMLEAGAIRVEMTSPSYAPTEDTMIQVAGTVSITYGGIEYE